MKVCDIRGWGYLTGKGARALPDDEAVAIQTANENLIAAAPELYEALEEARRIIAEERDVMVDCATTPPDHDIATLDPMTKPYVDEYDAALAKIAAALAKARGEA